MESKAIMELGEYTALVRENESLKALLRTCRGKMEQELCRCIPDYEIRGLGKDELLGIASAGDECLVRKYAYANSVRSLAEEWPCFTKEEVIASAARHIRETAAEKLDDLSTED